MTKEEKDRPFAMPEATPGQIVLWHSTGRRNGGNPPIVAVVSRVSSPRHLDIYPLISRTERIGVRHVDDHHARQEELDMVGAWEHTQATKDLQEAMRLFRQPSGLVKMGVDPGSDSGSITIKEAIKSQPQAREMAAAR